MTSSSIHPEVAVVTKPSELIATRKYEHSNQYYFFHAICMSLHVGID